VVWGFIISVSEVMPLAKYTLPNGTDKKREFIIGRG
jgi:hypothetical protein